MFKNKGFTIIEVSILLVIFLIVALLLIPLSLDDTRQARNLSKWKNIQQEFDNILQSAKVIKANENLDFNTALDKVISSNVKSDLKKYNIHFLNKSGEKDFQFDNYKLTHANAVVAIRFHEQPDENGSLGQIMYDLNGKLRPNTWGKDVFGFNIYEHRLEPFGLNKTFNEQKTDCSKRGTGLFCSSYYLNGGDFDLQQ
ncbi:MAG: type II secretion system GspH family protein [bacterium]|nr:type II secretion system GspH family protein [bacterium]